jgi:iron complex transport system ATP-binding protein
MESIGIEHIAAQPYTELSGGQRQMVLIARALAQDTGLIILDEPTSSLDFKNQIKVWKTLNALKETNKTIVVCTHDPNHVLWFCSQVLVLHHGRVMAAGDTKETITRALLEQLYGPVCKVHSGIVTPR